MGWGSLAFRTVLTNIPTWPHRELASPLHLPNLDFSSPPLNSRQLRPEEIPPGEARVPSLVFLKEMQRSFMFISCLSTPGTNLGEEGARALAAVLRENTSLTELYLSCTPTTSHPPGGGTHWRWNGTVDQHTSRVAQGSPYSLLACPFPVQGCFFLILLETRKTSLVELTPPLCPTTTPRLENTFSDV